MYPNYAKQVADPFDRALTEHSASKKCEEGTSGYWGIDSREPNFGAYYESSMSRSAAINEITQLAQKNGFRLTQATANLNPGYASNEFIENYYYDNTSKVDQFPKLVQGPTELIFEIINSGDFELNKQSCEGDNNIYNDEDHTAIHLIVRLPSVR
jgi:hypothetical protein